MVSWYFDTTKNTLVNVKAPESIHDLFENLSPKKGTVIVRETLERGYVVNESLAVLYRVKQNTPVNEAKILNEFQDQLEKLQRSILPIQRRYEKLGEFHLCNSPAEKYGLLSGYIMHPNSIYKSYYIPSTMKDYLQELADKVNTNISHLILDFCFSGLAFLTLREQQKNDQKIFTKSLLENCDKLEKTRIGTFEKKTNGNYQIKLGFFEEKKTQPITPYSIRIMEIPNDQK